MPGSIIFRPIEANLSHDTELIFKMDPYVSFIYGETKVNTKVCKKGGKHPHWDDAVTILPNVNDSKVRVQIVDHDKITKDDVVGTIDINLKEVELEAAASKWYPIFYKNKQAGELLMETIYQATGAPLIASTESVKLVNAEDILIRHDSELLNSNAALGTEVIAQSEQKITEEPIASRVFTEQHQVLSAHTFTKNVDVVETIPVLKQIEVMEPVKVIKEVEYTEAVPVTKEIEVAVPQVVLKEVETLEPRVVTKTIKVIENVAVKRQVEIIQMKTTIKEVECWEPQTFKKEVEVLEYFPVKKMVEVTEPVTVMKNVEFVEPVITTKTVVKETFEPMVVEEKITTTVGPATVIGTEIKEHLITEAIKESKIITEPLVVKEAVILTNEPVIVKKTL